MGKLTAKRLDFVREFRISLNATQAYKKAYGVSEDVARRAGSRLLTKVDVQSELAKGQAKTAEKFEISILEYQRRLAEKAYLDPMELYDETPDGDLKCKPLSEMTPAARQMVLKPKTTTIETENGIISSTTFLTKDALKAEELLGKSIGAFQNDINLAGDRPIFVGIQVIIKK